MDKRFLYYAAVCILVALIVSDTISWFVWQYTPLTRIDVDF